MRASIFVAALIAAGCSTAAISAEVKKDTKTPVVKAQKMTDADMDKVTAGDNYHAAFADCCYFPNSYYTGLGGSSSGNANVNFNASNNGFRGN